MCEALRELFADELEQGVKHGVELGMEKGIQAMILDNMEEGVAAERICEKLQRRFELTPEKARAYVDKYGVEK